MAHVLACEDGQLGDRVPRRVAHRELPERVACVYRRGDAFRQRDLLRQAGCTVPRTPSVTGTGGSTSSGVTVTSDQVEKP